jgi:hypothetical protein
MYTSSGIITNKQDQKTGWFFLQCDEAIGEYYKWLYSRAGFSWNSCLNGVHITFIAGEKDSRLITNQDMKDYLGLSIGFEYSGIIYTNSRAFWTPVKCDALQEIRLSLGLSVHDRLHLTLGNVKHLENNR